MIESRDRTYLSWSLLLLAFGFVAGAGCSVFEPPPPATSTGAIVGAEACDEAMLLEPVKPGPENRHLNCATTTGRNPDTLGCIEDFAGYPDGQTLYFHIATGPNDPQREPGGQKWHVHVQLPNTASTQPISVFVLNSCSGGYNSCANRNAGMQTLGGVHLSFLADPGKDYVVGVSVPTTSCDPGDLPSLFVQHDLCGDGIVQHGEACDSNATSCIQCKFVLQNEAMGMESNDSPLDAQVIPLSASDTADDPFRITDGKVGVSASEVSPDAGFGKIVGLDQYDFFAIKADVSGTVRAELHWTEDTEGDAGANCASAYLAAIQANDVWYTTEAQSASPPVAIQSTGGACTAALEFPVSAGGLSSYYLRVAAAPKSEVTYGLSVWLH